MLPIYLGVFLLSMATLAFQITLMRFFSVAQWYHFAFMAVSIALLGFGASGSFLSIFPKLVKKEKLMASLATLFTLGVIGSYLTINYIPFDSYCIAWDRVQFLYLAVYYLSLTLPFFSSGLVVGALLASRPNLVAKIYSFSFSGSALGCLVALFALPTLGGTGAVMLSALLGLLSAGAFLIRWKLKSVRRLAFGLLYLASLVILLFFVVKPPPFLMIRPSPYKSLSYALQYPGSEVILSRWNAFSKVDVVESGGIRSAPGLSLIYPYPPPPQLGIFTDGEDMSPITRMNSMDFINYLPVSLPYLLRPSAKALIIEPKGGLNVLVALQKGARHIVAVESNPLIIEVVREEFSEFAGGIYRDERVTVVAEYGRSYVQRTDESFDVIQISLSDSYRPVTSGAYSLSEDYLYTVEAFYEYLARLKEGGLLVVERWLQIPPSESLRTWALAVTALEREGLPPERRLMAIRSWSTSLILIKRGWFEESEIKAVKDFCTKRGFDLVYYPGIQEEEANRYNVLQEPYYYKAFQNLLFGDRGKFYAGYPYDVKPPEDDRPFFFHFFKIQQVPVILQTFGKIWEPFGGSGYLILIALLVLALLASAAFILAPLSLRRKKTRKEGKSRRWRVFTYFSLLGLGYLFIEIPLMQRFILFLGHPIYAFAAVLFSILLFSGLGSFASPKIPLNKVIPILCLAVILYPLALHKIFQMLLGQSLAVRFLISILVLAPLGFLMGVPFPKGISLVSERAPELIPWAWGVNGCTSVLSSILSTIGAISFGFSYVLYAACFSYFLAFLAMRGFRGKGA
jgi:hypothetical protein